MILVSAPSTRFQFPPSTRSVYTNPAVDCPPRSLRTRTAFTMGLSVPETDAARSSSAESTPMLVPPILPVNFVPPSGLTIRRV